MDRRLWLVTVLALLVWAAPNCGHAAQLRAGVAKVEITPPAKGTYLRGYSARTSPSIGLLDPLFARALVLEVGDERMALVSLDLCVFTSERVAQEARERFGIGLVLMNASHTHSGPTFDPKRWDDPAKCDQLRQRTEDRVLEAIEKATSAMFPARLSVAKGDIALGYHRLVMQPSGRRKPLWRNPERIPIGPVDPTVGVIRVEEVETGDPPYGARAVVVNYACHPVCLGGKNLSISADYVGAMAAKIEKSLSPPVICLFTQGGGGSVNPQFRGPEDTPADNWVAAQTMGQILADEVLRVLPDVQPVTAPDEIQWRTKTITFADRWESTGTVEVAMATVMLNRTIGIAAVPGEPFVQLQMAFTSGAPVEFPLFFGYTSFGNPNWPGYIPDIRSAAEGSYGAGYQTKIEVGAGERIVNQAIADLYWMKGMLLDKPER